VGVATVLKPGSSLFGRGSEWNGLWSHPAQGHQQASELDDGVFTKLRVISKLCWGMPALTQKAKQLSVDMASLDGKSLLSSSSLVEYSKARI
jgi:hypothetical protein